MTHTLRTLLICLPILFVGACSDDKPQENVFQGQVDALDKAKNVEGMLLEADQRQRDAIDNQSQ